MARPTVEYPCGCVVTDSHVVAMCVKHDQEIRRKTLETAKATDHWYADIRKTIDELGK